MVQKCLYYQIEFPTFYIWGSIKYDGFNIIIVLEYVVKVNIKYRLFIY